MWLCCSSLNWKCLYGFFHHTRWTWSYTSLCPVLLVHPLLCLQGVSVAHCPLFAPFPRFNQSLQGVCVLPWLASELQALVVRLGLRKKDMPLEVDFFWGSSNWCWDLSCWLMMIWMSSWRKDGQKEEISRKTGQRGLNTVSTALISFKLSIYSTSIWLY